MPVVSGGLPMIMGIIKDTADDGTPPEVTPLIMDEMGS